MFRDYIMSDCNLEGVWKPKVTQYYHKGVRGNIHKKINALAMIENGALKCSTLWHFNCKADGAADEDIGDIGELEADNIPQDSEGIDDEALLLQWCGESNESSGEQ